MGNPVAAHFLQIPIGPFSCRPGIIVDGSSPRQFFANSVRQFLKPIIVNFTGEGVSLPEKLVAKTRSGKGDSSWTEDMRRRVFYNIRRPLGFEVSGRV